MSVPTMPRRLDVRQIAIWSAVAILGAVAWGVLALARGESVNAVWMLFAALCSYAIAYRFYARFIANRVLGQDNRRATPAERLDNAVDFHKTDRRVLFGHHFAAIAGAGPLVGPVLAAQMGYLPGTIWIIVGVIFAGAVQDMVILFFSMRRDGKSLGQMAREEIGPFGGAAALVAVLLIMIILLAVLALVVVNALGESPWGTFSIAMTIPIALFMGVYMRMLRPGRVVETSVIGVVLLLLAIGLGSFVAESRWAEAFTLSHENLVFCLVIYGFAASVLPVWLLLAPRDYLSTFMKVGTIALLAIGILLTLPVLKIPAFTDFAFNGQGPVFAGSLFPFVFITIACGAISGFHALVASGTTPKLLENETDARPIGYGAMLMESLVAVMALIAACVLTPGLYFAINAPAAALGTTAESAATAIAQWGFTVTPAEIQGIAAQVGEEVRADGFTLGTVTNAARTNQARSQVLYRNGQKTAASAVARRLGISETAQTDPLSGDLIDCGSQVVVGAFGPLRLGGAQEGGIGGRVGARHHRSRCASQSVIISTASARIITGAGSFE